MRSEPCGDPVLTLPGRDQLGCHPAQQGTGLDAAAALASQPEETFKIKVIRIEPSAVAKEEGNVFLVRCELAEGFSSWWKPGMTGVSKLNAGERTLLWIFTHRTMDFLRLRLWW